MFFFGGVVEVKWCRVNLHKENCNLREEGGIGEVFMNKLGVLSLANPRLKHDTVIIPSTLKGLRVISSTLNPFLPLLTPPLRSFSIISTSSLSLKIWILFLSLSWDYFYLCIIIKRCCFVVGSFTREKVFPTTPHAFSSPSPPHQ